MRLIKGFVIIFGCLFFGELLSTYLPLPFPGNIIGLVLLFAALTAGLIKLDDVSDAGKLFLDNLVLLFIPLGVGIMRYFDLLRDQIPALLIVGVAGYLILFLFSGKLVDLSAIKKER